MKVANFSANQFVDATGPGGLDAAFGTVSGAMTSVASGAWASAGLIAPEAMTVSFSGMTATVGLPQPWGLIASGGVMVRAHGAVTNQETTNYTANFAGLVPASGTLTAYLAATPVLIQQNPVPIPGPPPGHPSYNPNFVPSVSYAAAVYSVALTAVTGVPDNAGSFELFRTTLTAAQTTLAAYNTVGQQRAANRRAWPMHVLASGGLLTVQQSQQVLAPAVPGLTHTLPSAATAGGLTYGLVNPTSGNWTIVASGADRILGTVIGSGVASTTVPASGAALLWGDAVAGAWFMMGSSDDSTSSGEQTFTSSGTFTAPPGVTLVKARVWGAGGGGGGTHSIGDAAGGGGGGGYAEGVFTVIPGTGYLATVGVAGTAGASGASPTAGGSGGTSSFASLESATGGLGGNAANGAIQATSVLGGTGAGGSFVQAGDSGWLAFAVGSGAIFSAPGGASFGCGATHNIVSAFAGATNPGAFPGQGGCGGINGGAGAIGANGLVIIEW
jgi:hypothetical protein